MTLLAHKDADGGVQTLRDHLHNAGDLAESYESEFSQIPRMAALLHDVGKVAQQFQTYLISGKGRRGEIPHARQGAFVVNDLPISNSAAEIVKEILELVIAKHHGELPDCINEIGDEAFLTGFTEADKQNPKYAYGEIKQGLHDLDLDLQDTFQQAEKDVFDFVGRTKLLKLSKDSRYFYSGLLVKYVYSRLIDADRTDTAYFETKEQYHPIKADWSELIRRLDESMKSFDSTSEINKIRQQITEQCRQAGSRETGIYRLSVPTGGGKTLASLNFALHHALETGKRRIIYVIPYLSITSQTVATFRNMLGLDADSNIVLEHYSTAGLQNSGNTGSIGTSEEEDAKERQRKLASERWDNPIIVTTMVEFLETVMSARGTKLRKFHNMANSVIIFDEIQSLPLNIINPFNEVVSFLSTILDSTILLCSATQPLLERTARKNLRLSDEPDLIDNTDGYEEKLKRTRIIASQESKSCEELANIIYEQALRNGNCLSIVNTKSEARKMYQCLQELNADGQFELIHLSTAMCGKHRADQLARIKVLTDPHDSKPVICVSTQLIEAGVDLSFACVVRAMAGLDSIMQAAGRCNRNGESKEIKDVYVYPLQGEERFKDYLPEIHRGKKLTLQIYLTTAGHLEHERAHDYAASESRGDTLIMRDLRVYSRALGITGACDVVEFHKSNDGVPLHGRDGLWLPYPIEYKHGKSKTIDADRLQLCAEAMCLEEMLACDIPEGALFYRQTKRRERVKLDEDLRNMVEADFLQMHDLFSRGWTPKVKQTRSCSSCSLRDLCLPELRKVKSAKAYIEERLKESGE